MIRTILLSPLLLFAWTSFAANPPDDDSVVSISDWRSQRDPLLRINRNGQIKTAFVWRIIDGLKSENPSDALTALRDLQLVLATDFFDKLPDQTPVKIVARDADILMEKNPFPRTLEQSKLLRLVLMSGLRLSNGEFRSRFKDEELGTLLLRVAQSNGPDAELAMDVLATLDISQSKIRSGLVRALVLRYTGVARYSVSDAFNDQVERLITRPHFDSELLFEHRKTIKKTGPEDLSLNHDKVLSELKSAYSAELNKRRTTADEIDPLIELIRMWKSHRGEVGGIALTASLRILSWSGRNTEDARETIALASLKDDVAQSLLTTSNNINSFLKIAQSDDDDWRDIGPNIESTRGLLLGTFMQKSAPTAQSAMELLRSAEITPEQRADILRAINQVRKLESVTYLRAMLNDDLATRADLLVFAPDFFDRAYPADLKKDLGRASLGEKLAVLNGLRVKALQSGRRIDPNLNSAYALLNTMIAEAIPPNSAESYAKIISVLRTERALGVMNQHTHELALGILFGTRDAPLLATYRATAVREAEAYLQKSVTVYGLEHALTKDLTEENLPNLRARFSLASHLARSDSQVQEQLFGQIDNPRLTRLVVTALDEASINDFRLRRRAAKWVEQHQNLKRYFSEITGEAFMNAQFNEWPTLSSSDCEVLLFRPRETQTPGTN